MGTVNKNHSRKLAGIPCPICGKKVKINNHGKWWWISCTGDIDGERPHINQVLFDSAEFAIDTWHIMSKFRRT